MTDATRISLSKRLVACAIGALGLTATAASAVITSISFSDNLLSGCAACSIANVGDPIDITATVGTDLTAGPVFYFYSWDFPVTATTYISSQSFTSSSTPPTPSSVMSIDSTLSAAAFPTAPGSPYPFQFGVYEFVFDEDADLASFASTYSSLIDLIVAINDCDPSPGGALCTALTGFSGLLDIGNETSGLTMTITESGPLPEPATLALLGLGLAGFGLRRKVKRA